MKTTLNTLITALLISGFAFAQSGTKNFIDQPYIEVSGQAEMEITPDEIYLRIVLNENDKKGRISIEKQENQMLTKLRNCDINIDKQLSVEDFDGFYKRKFLGSNELSKTKRYQLLIHDGETLAKVYQELDEIDISNISIIKVDHSEMEKLRSKTKLSALKIAKKKASDYAQAIDQSIGKALFIQENSNQYQSSNIVFASNSNVKRYDAMESINDLDIKKIVISERVLAKFTLE
jgi:uncharacterized protein YggE